MSLVPDFVLGFAFFVALSYAVLGRRFGRERPAVAMSVSLGLALSVGLVWWEHANGWSIRDLGPVAVGFALIVLAGVMYEAIRRVGGNWSGAFIAFGACLLVGWSLGMPWPVDARVVQTVLAAALVLGGLSFLMHRQSHGIPARRARPESAAARHDIGDLYHDRRVADRLRRRLAGLRDEASLIDQRPELAPHLMAQLRRILPVEGWLTERLAGLRTRAHLMRAGHAEKFEETQALFEQLPVAARRRLARELKARYRELEFDVRLERLDTTVAETERRVCELTREAQARLEAHDFRKVPDILEAATKLPGHNARLLRLIERSEARLLRAIRQVARLTYEVSDA